MSPFSVRYVYQIALNKGVGFVPDLDKSSRYDIDIGANETLNIDISF
jgi:hypothetical protein